MKTDHQGTSHRSLREILGHAAHLLPMQGPIGVFIHHNTLHAFQHLPFEEAVAEASRLFGTEPYMSEAQYRSELERGRILLEDVDAVLPEEPAEPVFGTIRRHSLRRALLYPGAKPLHPATIRWELEEGDLLQSREDADLFTACLERTDPEPIPTSVRPRRLRDVIFETTGDDIDDLVHPFLIRFCAAFLDQGLAYWPMPQREDGFYAAVRTLWMQPGGVLPEHLRRLPAEFRRQLESGWSADEAVSAALQELRVAPGEQEKFILAELLALPGWAGLMSRLEQDPELAHHEILRCSLMDFLAVRLTLTTVAIRSITGEEGFSRSTYSGPAVPPEAERMVRAARLYQAARLLRLPTSGLIQADNESVRRLQQEIEAFDDGERRRVWHLAYERRHERMILGPLAAHRKLSPPAPPAKRPAAQVFFCIDEREESIRRHLEEVAPEMETLSAAGFFGVAVNYAGIDDAHGVPLCPVVVKPQHAVREKPVHGHHHLHERRQALRALWARFAHYESISSRTMVRGALSTLVLGIFSLFPLIAHVLKPRQYGRLSRALNRWLLPEPRTELTLMRTDRQGHDVAEHLLLGFTVPEKVDRVASVLGPAGLRERFSPIVVVLGHGSTSLNNPHESAHDCGACGGRRGGPNARLFAAMANHPDVRRGLREVGIVIPQDTWFVGGYHDTCSDEIEYYDLDALPGTHQEQFRSVTDALDRARALDAHERSRRFEAAPDDASPEQALWHVQERSEHLAEPRPEYGHCTNAVCIVGRRSVTRGLFLDRRSFLVSYDPTLDPAGENLGRLLAAAIPVCGGISLEYYFSFVDNEGYGCGTKLPHNITGLVGIMNGHASDLRTGLPWQMVEIHEPVRILFNVETTPAILMRVIHANPLLAEFVVNRWIRLSTMDPDTGEVHVYRDGQFEFSAPVPAPLPEAATSASWYNGRREHLPIARIGSAPSKTEAVLA